MASTAQAVNRSSQGVVNFAPSEVKAPLLLRCAALFVDYILLLGLPTLWLLWGRLISDTSANSAPGGLVWFLTVVLLVVDLILLPLLIGRTFGKMVTGLTILKIDGSAIDLVSILRRNVLGYFLTLATLGIGFLVSALNSSGRSLHDLVGGTIVVQGRKRPL